MSEAQAKAISELSALADKIALELVFAGPGSDNGLLPINCFIASMEDLCAPDEIPAPAREAVGRGRAIVDGIFDSGGYFSKETIDAFGAWLPWFQSVLLSIKNSQPAPPFAPEAAAADARKPDEALQLSLDADRELLQEFCTESREHLQNIETGALALEENPADADTLNSIFRAFHTFKGGSGFLNLTPVNMLAHELESLLDLARRGKIQISSSVVEVILNGGDILRQFIDAIELQISGRAAENPIFIPIDGLRQRVADLIATPAQAEPAACQGQSGLIHRSATPEDSPQPAPAHSIGISSAVVKVDTCKLDSLIDMVGEMVIAQSLVSQDTDLKALSSPRLTRNLAQLARTTKELQRTAMSLRMVPIRSTFQKMNRLVRDLSVRAGKQIELQISGEDAELDRNIVEAISDPLIHMIRNSVDHGIESPADRAAAGKPLAGKIALEAFHQGGNFVIRIRDDGRGLNREKILKKAVEKGIINAGAELSEKEIFSLIFAPGFSTAEVITDLSGRGVGMDVVRKNIEQLRGKIETASTEGHGATFSISLPLTLAIIDGLIVRAGQDRYIIPTLSIRESFRPTRAMLSTVHERGELVNVRGRILPMLRLRHWLGAEPDSSDPTQGVIIVVEGDGAERCVLVDELIGKQEVVIKSLGETFQANPLLAGAAILSDGSVGLILDVGSLVHSRFTPPSLLSKAA